MISLSADRASCVISDIQMLGMSGVELHRRMLAEGRGLPFIFVTAFPDNATHLRALSQESCRSKLELEASCQ
jgi:FixJ family two-component response regulator